MRIIVLTLAILCSPCSGGDDVPSLADAQKLIQRGKTDAAIAVIEKIVDADPDDAEAWASLAHVLHLNGDYARAHAAGQRAAEFPDFRATCLYNLACASSLMGDVERAATELRDAIAAGFVDYGLIEVDSDLAALRSAGQLPPMPKRQPYEVLKHNRVEIPYLVLLPDGYDAEATYPTVVAFSPGGMGARSTDGIVESLWSGADARGDCIVVCAAQPVKGWINHPSHHALEALLKQVRREHNVAGDRFHFVGVGAGGRAAATYSGMSGRYVQSLTLVDSRAISHWEDKDVAGLGGSRCLVSLVARAGNDAVGRETERIESLLRGQGKAVTTTRYETDTVSLHDVLAAAR